MTKTKIREEFEAFILGEIGRSHFDNFSENVNDIIVIGAFLKTYLDCDFVDEVLESLFDSIKTVSER